MNRPLTLGLLAIGLTAGIAIHHHGKNSPHYNPRMEAAAAREYRGAAEWLNLVRSNVSTGRVEAGDYMRMSKAVAAHARQQRKAASYNWIEMGPDNIGGRVRGICVDPQNSQKLWAGSVSGGLFRSLNGGNTWERIQAFDDNLMVTSIAVLGNGHLYVATGCAWEGISGTGGSGFVGKGLFRSDDDGTSFTNPLAPGSPWSASSDWAVINRIKADPMNPAALYIAAANPGARWYDESTNSVSTVLPSPATSLTAFDVEVTPIGSTVMFSVGSGDVWLGRDQLGGFTWDKMDGTNDGIGFPQSQIGRTELALSPDNPNYMYAIAATSGGRMSGVWSSSNWGYNWFRIWPHNLQGDPNAVPSLDIFGSNSQGNYDNAIAVRPGHPDEVWVGGVSLWKTSLSGSPQQLAITDGTPGCFNCVHADVHEIVFADDNTAYVGCDGGVYKTPNAGANFFAVNQNLSITQFYSMAYNPLGQVMGGTQDNGTIYIAGFGANSAQEGYEVAGGDGFDCDMSQMDTNIMFASVYYGDIFRSNDHGNNFGDFYDENVPVDPNADLGAGLGDFYTNFRLFENPKDLNSPDSVKLVYYIEPGDTIFPGQTRAVPFRGAVFSVLQYGSYTNNTGSAHIGPWTSDTLKMQDRVTSVLAAGFTDAQGVWVTRGSLNFNITPEWANVAGSTAGGNVTCLEWSADGDALFYGTSGGEVIRITGFNNAYTVDDLEALSANKQTIFSSGGVITGLAPDPSNVNGLVLTMGQYGSSAKVRRTDVALQASVNWTDIWNVPSEIEGMPCYDACIHKDNGNIIAVGTEFGVWVTDDGGGSWTIQTNGIENMPVFAMRQQTWNWENNPVGPDWIKNPNVIYAGTHGRGIYRTEALVSVPPVGRGAKPLIDGLLLMPNPATTQSIVSFDLARQGDVVVSVYDLRGAVVATVARRNMAAARQNITVPVENLSNGTFIVEVRSGDQRTTGRLVVAK